MYILFLKRESLKNLGSNHILASQIVIVWCAKNLTQQCSKILLVKNSENDFIFLYAFYLIICLMKPKKKFEKIAILKTREVVSFWSRCQKSLRRNTPKMMYFKARKNTDFSQYFVVACDPIKIPNKKKKSIRKRGFLSFHKPPIHLHFFWFKNINL